MNEIQLRDALLGIQMIGLQHRDDADEYMCPACFKRCKILGYCSSTKSFEGAPIVHSVTCPLMKIRLPEVDY